jgi:hypothetical protein
VKCPRCEAAGDKSKVFAPYGSVSTLMGHSSYWDEDGVYHSHDPNWHGSEYSCSLRHRWAVRWMSACPAGDYGGEKETTYLDPLPIPNVYRQDEDGLVGPFLGPAN